MNDLQPLLEEVCVWQVGKQCALLSIVSHVSCKSPLLFLKQLLAVCFGWFGDNSVPIFND